MKPLELAFSYLDIFFSGTNFEAMHQILDEICSFEGPFFQSRSAEDYITALKADPPKDSTYTLACVFYEFS